MGGAFAGFITFSSLDAAVRGHLGAHARVDSIRSRRLTLNSRCHINMALKFVSIHP